MGAELRSMSAEVAYSILIFIVAVSFIQWLSKGFYGKSLLPPEHIPATLMFTASAPVLYRVVKHLIKSKKVSTHRVGEEYRGSPSMPLQNDGVAPVSATPSTPPDLINTPPAGGAAEAAGAQTGGADKVPESLKHPTSEKEVEKGGGGEVRENTQNEGVGVDEVAIAITEEELELLRSLRERLTLLRRRWGLLSYS
jgi:hypothetical protein